MRIGMIQGGGGATSGIDFYANSSVGMSLDGAANVGIGITNPGRPLDVVAAGINQGAVTGGPGAPDTYFSQLRASDPDGDGITLGALNGAVAGTYGVISGSASGDGLLFNTRVGGVETARMVIANGGNVGIGTTGPGYKLDVAGQINTNTGVSLNGTFYTNPDYVFEPDYPLLPLDQVEAFTASNKHLPHVPSTQEVRKKGVEIFEQNRVVLENLEAAYRYIFQLNAQLKSLQADSVKQQAEIEALRIELRALQTR
jgi:hypothetical protein